LPNKWTLKNYLHTILVVNQNKIMIILKRLAGDMAVALFILLVIGSAYFITAQRILFQKERIANIQPTQVTMNYEQSMFHDYVAKLREEEYEAIRTGKGSEEEV